MITIYLAGKIFENKVANEWRKTMVDVWGREFNFINPIDYETKKMSPKQIVELDLKLIDKSDWVLAYILEPSAGTSMEIFYAHSKNKPVVVVAKREQSPWIYANSNLACKSLREAVSVLRIFNKVKV